MTATAPFLEIDREDGTAPFDWCFPPDQCVPVRFGVRHDLAAVEAGVLIELPPGQGRSIAIAEPDAARGTGYDLFRATLPAPGIETAHRYRLGFRTRGEPWIWHRESRTVVWTSAPGSAAEVSSVFLGQAAGKPVYGPKPRRPLTPSPERWRPRTFYSLILDRFSAGDPDHHGLGLVPFDPSDPFASHGGTFRGCAEKLDYLVELGIGAIVLTPVYLNATDGYHGYHPLHLFAVDPRLGTLEDLRTLIAAAHARGLAVLLDVLTNHMADAIAWSRTPDGPTGRFRYELGDHAVPLPYPRELRDTAFFHPGNGTDPIRSPLFGFLADWRTEHPFVRDILVKHLKYWIAETDCDGFRFDAVRHVDPPFWEHALDEIRAYATVIGKERFFLLGEHADEQTEVVGAWGRAAGFTGMIDYPLHYKLRAIFEEQRADLRTLAGHFSTDCFAHRDSRCNLAFLDNQDTSRFLHHWGERFGSIGRARSRLGAALALIMLGPEIPCLYYGTEQEFTGAIGWYQDAEGRWHGHDVHVREDMALTKDQPCQWRFGPVNQPRHPPYDTANPTFRTIADLTRLRAETPALHQGDRHAVIDDDPWLIVWLMADLDTADLVLVAINLWDGAVVRRLPLADMAPTLPTALRPPAYAQPAGNLLYAVGDANADLDAAELVLTMAPDSVLVLRLDWNAVEQ